MPVGDGEQPVQRAWEGMGGAAGGGGNLDVRKEGGGGAVWC